MYTGFNSILGFETQPLKNEFVCICDANLDGNFILHHFISYGLKHDTMVSLLGFAQTFTHYKSVSHKLGLNMQNAVDQNQFCFTDMLTELSNGFLFEDSAGSESSPDFAFPMSEKFTLKKLYELIQSKVSQGCRMVILDDLCALVNIGVSVQVIADFLHYCKVLNVENNVSFVFLTHQSEDDGDYSLLLNYLHHYATVEIFVKALETGYSKDLSGEIRILRRSEESPNVLKQRLHFKFHDKDVKFFAPGTSKAVL